MMHISLAKLGCSLNNSSDQGGVGHPSSKHVARSASLEIILMTML